MPERIIFMNIHFSITTEPQKLNTLDRLSGLGVYGSEYEAKGMPEISAGTWTLTSGTGSASLYPDSNDPNAVLTVSNFSLKDYSWSAVNYCRNHIAGFEVAFFGVPVANSGFYNEKRNLTYKPNVTHFLSNPLTQKLSHYEAL